MASLLTLLRTGSDSGRSNPQRDSSYSEASFDSVSTTPDSPFFRSKPQSRLLETLKRRPSREAPLACDQSQKEQQRAALLNIKSQPSSSKKLEMKIPRLFKELGYTANNYNVSEEASSKHERCDLIICPDFRSGFCSRGASCFQSHQTLSTTRQDLCQHLESELISKITMGTSLEKAIDEQAYDNSSIVSKPTSSLFFQRNLNSRRSH